MEKTSRQVYIDWLRILAVLGVLFFHSAMPYVPDFWHIKNKDTSNILMEFNFFISRFRMPLLFFISGSVTHVMLQKRSSLQFIALRFRRLFIPLIFGIIAIVPLQVYMERLSEGFKGNFWSFYPTVFTTGFYPKGNFSFHHLWFIAYLFVYDVVFAPFLKALTNNKKLSLLFEQLFKSKRIYFLIIPSVIWFTLMAPWFPQTDALINDPCWAVYWLLFLLAGFICFNSPELLQSLQENRRTSLTFAFLTILILNYMRWNKLEPGFIFQKPLEHWQTFVYLSIYPITAWLWMFSAVGYGKKYLNKKPGAMPYINKAVYPFYILHQTIIVVLSYYVVQTSDTILMKYIFTLVVTFIISMMILHLFVVRSNILRFLFGMKSENTERNVQKEMGKLREHSYEKVI